MLVLQRAGLNKHIAAARTLPIVIASLLTACATGTTTHSHCIPRRWFTGEVEKYGALPGQKAFYVAFDRDHGPAIGYSYGEASLQAAEQVARQKCDAVRTRDGITAECYPFAVNNQLMGYNVTRQYCHHQTSDGSGPTTDDSSMDFRLDKENLRILNYQ